MFLRLRVSWTSRFGACAAARFRGRLHYLQHFVHQCFALREVVNVTGSSRFRLDWSNSNGGPGLRVGLVIYSAAKLVS